MAEHDFIAVIDDVLSKEQCQRYIDAFEHSKGQSPGRTGGGVDPDRKNSVDVSLSGAEDMHDVLKEVLPIAGEQILKYFDKHHFALLGPIGLTVKHPDSGKPVKLTQDNFDEVGRPNFRNLLNYLFRIGEINAQRYTANEGGYPYWHSEVYPQAPHNEALHRILLFMFYLNDVEEGGETEFFYQGRSISPKAGRMVIAPAYFTHTHRGNIPKSNDKYILTSWVLFNRAEQIYTQNQNS
ncbi:2OG-Fe(II) oxygenase [Aestuariibacter salexigens]|uniref:2OG-Fe(II) oxygenase n=1 Tax=Aestuariibacter salexigens TaxID=226010 RepID=UPI0004200F5F|nr:2OG-Fe(II) oxygenase [Aestuariibacter salexigens]